MILKNLTAVVCEMGNRGNYIFKSNVRYIKTIICPNITSWNGCTNSTFFLIVDPETYFPIDGKYKELERSVIYTGTEKDVKKMTDSIDVVKSVIEDHTIETSNYSRTSLYETIFDSVIYSDVLGFVTTINKELFNCRIVHCFKELRKSEPYKVIEKEPYKYMAALYLVSNFVQIYIKNSEIKVKDNKNVYFVDRETIYSKQWLEKYIDDIVNVCKKDYKLIDLDK